MTSLIASLHMNALTLSTLLCGVTFGWALPLSLQAQTVYSEPIGFSTITAVAGTGTARAATRLSFPLLGKTKVSGQTSGRITLVGPATLTNSAAGWMPGALSNPATPYLIRICSGKAQGLTLLISSVTPNSATTITLDAEDARKVDLTKLGITLGPDGDTYTIVECDTLSTLFGTPSTSGILGGANAGVSDQIQVLLNNAWRTYYYCTSGSGNWRLAGAETLADNLPIRPDTAVSYHRLGATPLNFQVTGTVPVIDRMAPVTNAGLTFLATFWPTNTTLKATNIAAIPGWLKGTDMNVADYVQMLKEGTLNYTYYCFDGVNWRDTATSNISDNVVIPQGSGILIYKRGSATGASLLKQSLPYLNQ